MRDGAGTAGAIAAALLVAFATLPFVAVVAFYTFLSVYAVAKMIGDGANANAIVVLLGLVAVVATFATGVLVVARLVGRSLDPKRSRM